MLMNCNFDEKIVLSYYDHQLLDKRNSVYPKPALRLLLSPYCVYTPNTFSLCKCKQCLPNVKALFAQRS